MKRTPASTSARRLLRRARKSVPAWGIGGLDRAAGTIVRSGFFKHRYYEAQTPATFGSALAAARHYLTEGHAAGLLPNPIHDFTLVSLPDAEAVRRPDFSAVSAAYPTRRLFDDDAYARLFGLGPDVPGGLAGHYLKHSDDAAAAAFRLGHSRGLRRTWEEYEQLSQRRKRMMRVISAAGVFDTAYYELQADTAFASDRAAIWHYLEEGEFRDLSPHPLFEPDWYRTEARLTSIAALVHYVRTRGAEGSAGPHLDTDSYLLRHPEAADTKGGPLGHFAQTATESTLTSPSDPGTAVAWSDLRDLLTHRARETARQERERTPRSTWTPRASATLTLGRASTAGTAATTSILAHAAELTDDSFDLALTLLEQTHPSWELLVGVDPGDPLGVAKRAASFAEIDERIRLVPVGHPSLAGRLNQLVEAADGTHIAVWKPDTTWDARLLEALHAAAGPSGTAYAVSAPRRPVGATADDPVYDTELSLEGGGYWTRERNLSGFLVEKDAFQRVGPFDETLPGAHEWDWILRAAPALDPTFVPLAGVTAAAAKPIPLDGRGWDAPSGAHVVRARVLLDWEELNAQVGHRVSGRVSLLIPTFHDWTLTRQAVDSVLATTDGVDVEVVIVDNGSDPHVGSILTSHYASDARVHLHRLPCNTNFATGSNWAFAKSTGEICVFLNNDTEARTPFLASLVSSLERADVRGAQPLLLYPDGTIQSAGTVFHGGDVLPWHFLAGHPREDAPAVGELEYAAVTAACMAVRAHEVATLRGFDPGYANGMEDVDYCLRATETWGGHFVVRADAEVIHHESKSPGRFHSRPENQVVFLDRWTGKMPPSDVARYRDVGLDVPHFESSEKTPRTTLRSHVSPLVVRTPRLVESGEAAGLPALRWAIKNPAVAGPRGDAWGDTFFADDLAHALRILGQEVVIDRLPAHTRVKTDHLDDVVVALRGLTRVAPQGGATNVLWVISHPELVTRHELRSGWDLVYAASSTWSQEASLLGDRPVKPLLQATNPSRFTVDGPGLEGNDVLFVGRTRKVFRAIVRDAIEIGAPLSIYGDGWDEFIDPVWVKADHLANEQLPDAYRGARIVLNDHWEYMAAHGFHSNRLFDAVASGARVVSDEVAGVEELFSGSVRTYSTPDELAALLDPDAAGWPSPEQLLATARAVRDEHSFLNRARQLLGSVLDSRGVAHHL